MLSKPAPRRMICSECGSTDVLADAYASWNEELQLWEVDETFAKGGHCRACEGPCTVQEQLIDRREEAFSIEQQDHDGDVWFWQGDGITSPAFATEGEARIALRAYLGIAS